MKTRHTTHAQDSVHTDGNLRPSMSSLDSHGHTDQLSIASQGKTKQTKTPELGAPWWRHGHAWLVFGLPFSVVIASFITLYFAIKYQDPVLDVNYYAKGLALSNTPADAALVPAQAARNHATTGGVPAK